MHARLAALGMRAVLVTALDREELSAEDVACAVDSGHWEVSKGEASLALKHMAVYRHMLRTGVREALVLEDDAQVGL